MNIIALFSYLLSISPTFSHAPSPLIKVRLTPSKALYTESNKLQTTVVTTIISTPPLPESIKENKAFAFYCVGRFPFILLRGLNYPHKGIAKQTWWLRYVLLAHESKMQSFFQGLSSMDTERSLSRGFALDSFYGNRLNLFRLTW